MKLTRSSAFVLATGIAIAVAAPASSNTSKSGSSPTSYNAISNTSKSTSVHRVGMKVARATALAEVPRGVVKSEELERENGRLIYTFDIRQHGKSGLEEINVDARTGKVLKREHETAAKERHEAAMEKKVASKATTKGSTR